LNVYTHGNFTFENRNNKSVLYKDGRILFLGNPWCGILEFLHATNNAPEVREMFKAQLEQREQLRYKLQEQLIQ